MAKLATSSESRSTGLTKDGLPAPGRAPVPPPMRVVTKGWWVSREELVPREELERQDREAAARR